MPCRPPNTFKKPNLEACHVSYILGNAKVFFFKAIIWNEFVTFFLVDYEDGIARLHLLSLPNAVTKLQALGLLIQLELPKSKTATISSSNY